MEDEPLPLLDELAGDHQAGLAWVVAGHTDAPVAYLIADRIDGNLHVEQVSVHPDNARRGVGRLLLDHLATHATGEGVHALTLTTFTEVPWNAPDHTLWLSTMDDSGLTPGLWRDPRT